MAVTLGTLTLGTVRDVTFEHTRRLSDVDIPTAEGSSTEDLGKQGMPINLMGALSGDSRFSDFDQLERVSRLGRSLKFDCDMLQTVAFLKTVKLTRQTPTVLNYALALKQSRFKKVCACDLTDYWSVDSGGGSLSAVTSTPTPKEGLTCLARAPLRSVQVNDVGPEHKRFLWMCEACEHAWKKAHPKQVGLETFMGA